MRGPRFKRKSGGRLAGGAFQFPGTPLGFLGYSRVPSKNRIRRALRACHGPHPRTDHGSRPSGCAAELPFRPRAGSRRRRRQSYQPKARPPQPPPWVHQPQTIPSAEGAIHSGMRQAVGLQLNLIARGPKALPWAGMKQAVGLKTPDSRKAQLRSEPRLGIPTGFHHSARGCEERATLGRRAAEPATLLKGVVLGGGLRRIGRSGCNLFKVEAHRAVYPG